MRLPHVTEECLAASDYLVSPLTPGGAMFLMCLSALSTIIVGCEIIRLVRGGKMKKGTGRATPISLLVRYLVLVQAVCDLLFHLIDIGIAADCDSHPLMYILDQDSDPNYIFHQRTIMYKTIKEGLGLLSVWWHATTAYVVYSWIVLKYSALRLRRVRIPYCLVAAILFSVIRYMLFRELRKGLLGLYIGIFTFDIVLIPVPIIALLVWNFRTAKALKGQNQLSFAIERQSSLGQSNEGGSGGSFRGGLSRAKSQGGSRSGDKKEGEGELSRSDSQGGEGGGAEEGSVEEGSPRGLEGERRNTSGGSGNTTTGGTGVPSNFSVSDGSHSNLNLSMTFSRIMRSKTAGGAHSGGGNSEGSKGDSGMDAGGARTQIIHRLMRVSFAVSVLWLTIITVDLIIWIRFHVEGEGVVLGSSIIWLRAILLRVVGLTDAIIMGNVFAKCWQRPTKSSVRSRLAKGLSSARPIEFSFAPSMIPGFANREGSSRLMSGTSAGPSPEEEAEQLIHAVDLANLPKHASRRLEAVNLFATTWNCGGVEREVLEMGLPRIIGKWIPHGYDLYILGVQECQCLKELRRIVHDYLGGPEEYVQFGQEIGDAHILHGVIAITIYARTTDVNKEFFQVQRGTVTRVASGVSLGPIGRAANKGMVGISCRYYDCSLAIVTAHFASDKKGKNRVANRNKDASKTLTDLSLLWDSDEFDIHTQHSHTILLGDLNYRNSGTAIEVLSLIAESAQQAQAMFRKEHAAVSLAAAAAAAAPSPQSPPRQLCSDWRTKNYSRMSELPDEAATGPLFLSLFQPSMISGLSFASSQSGGPAFPSRVLPAIRLGLGISQISVLQGTYIAEGDEGEVSSTTRDPSSLEARGGGGGGRGPVGKDVDGMELPTTITSQMTFPTLSFSNRSINSRSSRGSKSRTSSTHTPRPRAWTMSEVSPWEWVHHYDELGRSMRERVVFWGFKEPPITFPPSYRWNRATILPSSHDEEMGGGDSPLSTTGLAGDYTQYNTLLAAYSIAVHDRPSGLVPHFSFARSMLSRLSSETHSGSGGTAPTPTAASGIISRSSSRGTIPTPTAISTIGGSMQHVDSDQSITDRTTNPSFSARVPSYTDRILTYSLPSKASGLKWRYYDMADEIMLSDHRPVAAALSMLIDRNVCGFMQLPSSSTSSTNLTHLNQDDHTRTLASSSFGNNLKREDSARSPVREGEGGTGGGGGGVGGAATPILPPLVAGPDASSHIAGPLDSNNNDLAVFTITLANPTVRLKTAAGSAIRLLNALSPVSSGVEPKEMTILMPLISEDPMAFERKASLLKEAMPGADYAESGSASSSSLRQVLWSQFPVRLRIVASKRFSEHMLIKVTGSQGTDLGQAIIPICLATATKEGPSTNTTMLEKKRSNSGITRQHSSGVDLPSRGREGGGLTAEVQEGLVALPPPSRGSSGGHSKRMQVLLSSGGVFKGWLTLDMKVKIRNVANGTNPSHPT